MNDRYWNEDRSNEDDFFDFGDRAVIDDALAPRTELEATFMHIQHVFHRAAASSGPPRGVKDSIWASVMAAPAAATLSASGPAAERGWSRPLPTTRESSRNGRWSFGSFAANATLALLIALVGFVSWKGLYGGNGPNQPPETSTIPAAALQVASPAATPAESADDVAWITSCDLSGDIPIVTQLTDSESPLTQTAIYLTQNDSTGADPRGTVSIGCEEWGRSILAENVVSMGRGPWPGVATIYVLPPEAVDIYDQQLGFVDVATGRTITFGVGEASEMSAVRWLAHGSPWVAGPSVDDPTEVLLTDLRTFEARSLADVLGMPVPGAPFLVSTPADDGSLAVGFARTGSIGADGGVYTTEVEGPDGILTLGASFNDIQWLPSPDRLPFSSPIAVSPNGSMLAVVSSGEGTTVPESYTFGIVDLSSGEAVAVSDSIPYDGTPRILWTQNGASAVFISGSTLQQLQVDGNGEPITVFDAGESLQELRRTWSPDVVVVTERQDHGSDASPDQTAQDIVYAVNLATGESTEFLGIDVSGMAGWVPESGALVMYEWLDVATERSTYTVFDPASGEQIGEITDAPSLQYSLATQNTVPGRNGVTLSNDGRTEALSLGTEFIYLFTTTGDTMSMDQIPTPGNSPLAANLELSPDGNQLAMTRVADESRTRYLLALDDAGASWTEIPTIVVGGPAPIGFVTGLGD